jgi:hypothetical protein
LVEVFPENHAIHIQRNVWTKYGINASANVGKLGATSSVCIEEELLTETEKISTRQRTYLEAIEKNRWRSSEWVQDQTLRFGILNSNIAESSNSMFKDACKGTWLETLDTILDKMRKQISTLPEESKRKKGVEEIGGLCML